MHMIALHDRLYIMCVDVCVYTLDCMYTYMKMPSHVPHNLGWECVSWF